MTVVNHPLGNAHLWTGNLDVGLINGRGFNCGVMVAKVAMDTVSLYQYDRSLAVMDRFVFREWLTLPHPEDFIVDDVRWVRRAATTFLTIRESARFRLNDQTTAYLKAVI
jgi:hypothetical protein